MTDRDEDIDSVKSVAGLSKITGILKFTGIAVGLLAILIILLVAFLVFTGGWYDGFGSMIKQAPTGSMTASEDESGVWTVRIDKIDPQVTVISVHWYLLDVRGNTKTDGLVSDIYGTKQGHGHGVIFTDVDFNGKLSPGDKFEVFPSEANSDLEDTDDLSGFSFLMKFEPTGDVIGYDIVFE